MTIKIKRSEEPICNIQFDVIKFSNKPKPEKEKQLIICCFSEFGCEVMGAMYCIPRLIQENPGMYVIVMGWYGRAYLYKHLVDEFWEVKEDYQFLRDKAMAFHHSSKNLTKIEKFVENLAGKVITSDKLGRIAVGNYCNECGHWWGEYKDAACPVEKCKSKNIIKALFSDTKYWKPRMTPIPKPSEEKLKKAEQYLKCKPGTKPVGIIARNRTTYGRNLQPEFYVKLIGRLESLKYTPVWLGEKQSTLACPVSHIVDFSRMEEARDLELTLAIVSKLALTVQFWTASTRLSAIVGTPYLLFESPDQLFGQGQEGYRMALTTTGNKKIVLSHFLNVYNNNDAALNLLERAVGEMEHGNWEDIIGLVDEPEVVLRLRQANLHRFAGISV